MPRISGVTFMPLFYSAAPLRRATTIAEEVADGIAQNRIAMRGRRGRLWNLPRSDHGPRVRRVFHGRPPADLRQHTGSDAPGAGLGRARDVVGRAAVGRAVGGCRPDRFAAETVGA